MCLVWCNCSWMFIYLKVSLIGRIRSNALVLNAHLGHQTSGQNNQKRATKAIIIYINVFICFLPSKYPTPPTLPQQTPIVLMCRFNTTGYKQMSVLFQILTSSIRLNTKIMFTFSCGRKLWNTLTVERYVRHAWLQQNKDVNQFTCKLPCFGNWRVICWATMAKVPWFLSPIIPTACYALATNFEWQTMMISLACSVPQSYCNNYCPKRPFKLSLFGYTWILMRV